MQLKHNVALNVILSYKNNNKKFKFPQTKNYLPAIKEKWLLQISDFSSEKNIYIMIS